jgi:hypothetical protein
MHAPVKHRVSGNVRPLGSDPRYGADPAPGENWLEASPGRP